MSDAEVEVRDGLSAIEALAATIFGEARNQGVEGQVAVGSVVRNRVLRPNAPPKTYQSVCFAPKQFSCWSHAGGAANYKATLGAAQHMVSWRGRSGSDVVVPNAGVLRQCVWVATGIITGSLLDNTKGADHYFADSIDMPSWAKEMTETVKIGNHRFFKA